MAKKPTNTATAPAAAAAPAPAQPWAKPAEAADKDADKGNGGGVNPPVVDARDETAPVPSAIGEGMVTPAPHHNPSDEELEQAARSEAANAASNLKSQIAGYQTRFKELSEEEAAEFEEAVAAATEAILSKLERRRKAKAMEVRLVSPTEHYGKKIVPNNAPEPAADEGDEDDAEQEEGN